MLDDPEIGCFAINWAATSHAKCLDNLRAFVRRVVEVTQFSADSDCFGGELEVRAHTVCWFGCSESRVSVWQAHPPQRRIGCVLGLVFCPERRVPTQGFNLSIYFPIVDLTVIRCAPVWNGSKLDVSDDWKQVFQLGDDIALRSTDVVAVKHQL